MDIEVKALLEEAVRIFDEENYKAAFVAFVAAYEACNENADRVEILNILDEAYYLPNSEDMQARYTRNMKLLSDYPYFRGKIRPVSGLSFTLYPVDDDVYYLFNAAEERFHGEYTPCSGPGERYFFENMKEQLCLEDADSFSDLLFLFDNVRASEDYGGDNHIYLRYSSPEPLERLMLSCDLGPVLEREKFVFLIGDENREHVPLDFKKEFGIDYSRKAPQPIRIEEVKRIIFWYKHAYSGTDLSCNVLGANSAIQYVSLFKFDTFSMLDGKPLYFSDSFHAVMNDLDTQYTVAKIKKILKRKNNLYVDFPDKNRFFSWLEATYSPAQAYTVADLFKAYFLFRYSQRRLNPRVVPALLFDPHMWDPGVYFSVICGFPYHITLTCMREPVMAFIRSYQNRIANWNAFQTKYILASDYSHTRFLNKELMNPYLGFRFEDLKAEPEKTVRAICKALNIPFEAAMLEQEAPMTDAEGHTVRGFDQAPLHHNLDQYLSDFDRLRLNIFYEPIHKYYDYPGFDSQEYPLDGALVMRLFSYPFRFERYKHESISAEQMHQWVQEVLQSTWRKQITCPRLIRPTEMEESADG